MTQMCQVMRERAIGMLNAGIPIRAVSVCLNIHHTTKTISTISQGLVIRDFAQTLEISEHSKSGLGTKTK
jgi:hypothetical protein